MIDRFTIDRILDAAQIVDVVGEFVQLKRRGVNYLGLCPFHNEKTPSFTVSPSKEIFKCFGCGKVGNSVNFVMEHEHLTYPEALKYLAKKYHIEVDEKELSREELEKQNERESLLVVSAYAARQFSENLFSTDEGISVGLTYFKERGFRQDTLKKFELGYSFEKRDAFSKKALGDGYKQDFLVKTGLSIQSEDRIFDRFSGRVMFPIHSLSGQVLGFGGRILKSDVKTAKYLNSPESEIYHKSRILYGIFQARKSITHEEKCYLVEGYTDVMSLHEAGVENVVASSGTSLTQEQVRLIKRFTPNITILYDGDPAGIKASIRGIDIVLEEGMNVKIVLLPEGEDPDSYSKKVSNEEFSRFLKENETDFIRFKTKLLLEEASNDPVMKANLIRDVVKSIAVIPEAINRTVYIKECSTVLEVAEPILYNEVNKLRAQKNFQDRNKYPGPEDLPVKPQPVIKPVQREPVSFYSEREIIRLLLKFGSTEFERMLNKEDGKEDVLTVSDYIVREITSDNLEFNDKVCSKIFSDFRFNTEQGLITGDKQFVKHEDPEISSLSADLLSDSHELSRIWQDKQTYVETEEMKLKEIVGDVVLKFKSDKIMILRKEIMFQLEEAVKTNDREKILTLQKRYANLSVALGLISKKLGNRILL
ncbi:MAG: DNA primase [Bacteroidetes bacterium GWF2_41_9]|nr:MAG: DNA primase [Bacteroidetes bacterium GWA2_40_15]OFX82868.1 MAG: DNA primase [Bacteroidetes bacterium GWC2_40_22]OFY61400.1 MAG: DNA primase [Bacteroidetes bacterium GWF2_41_9]HBH82708.1 DNA primase [Bacteroidales bacterium]